MILRRVFLAGLLLPAVVGITGCLEPLDDPETAYVVNGTFTHNLTTEQQDGFFELVERHDGEAIVATSLPASFRASGFDAESCQTVESTLGEASYVANISACQVYEPSPHTGG